MAKYTVYPSMNYVLNLVHNPGASRGQTVQYRFVLNTTNNRGFAESRNVYNHQIKASTTET